MTNLFLGGVRLLLSRTLIYAIKCIIWRIVRVLEGCCLFIMRLHDKGRFPVKWLANLILFTKPSAVSVAAVKWIDSRAWLQFQFFLNLFSRLLATNLSRRNDRSRTGPQTLLRFQRNGKRQWIPIYIPRLFTLSCCHQRYSLGWSWSWF